MIYVQSSTDYYDRSLTFKIFRSTVICLLDLKRVNLLQTVVELILSWVIPLPGRMAGMPWGNLYCCNSGVVAWWRGGVAAAALLTGHTWVKLSVWLPTIYDLFIFLRPLFIELSQPTLAKFIKIYQRIVTPYNIALKYKDLLNSGRCP